MLIILELIPTKISTYWLYSQKVNFADRANPIVAGVKILAN